MRLWTGRGKGHFPPRDCREGGKQHLILLKKRTVESAQELDVHKVDDNIDYRTELQHKAEMQPLKPPRHPSCREPSPRSLIRSAPFYLNPQGKSAAWH